MASCSLVIFVVFATVMHGFFAASSVASMEESSDVQLAQDKSTEAWTRAMNVIFDSIEGNSSSDYAKDAYLADVVEGCKYYLEAAQSSLGDDDSDDGFVSSLKSFVDNVFNAIDLAKSEGGTFPEILTKIKTIQTASQVKPVVKELTELSGSSSDLLRLKVIGDLNDLYSNVFGAIISRVRLNFGMGYGIEPSFRARAIAAAERISETLHTSLKNHKDDSVV